LAGSFGGFQNKLKSVQAIFVCSSIIEKIEITTVVSCVFPCYVKPQALSTLAGAGGVESTENFFSEARRYSWPIVGKRKRSVVL